MERDRNEKEGRRERPSGWFDEVDQQGGSIQIRTLDQGIRFLLFLFVSFI